MKRRRPMIDGWICPHCGQTNVRHGRGGSRACKAESPGPTCPGLVCECPDGKCFSKQLGYGWRRSPCPNAHCLHCGWRGSLRSKDFEREFGSSRCSKSSSGWHYVRVRIDRNLDPNSLRIMLECQLCGAKAVKMIDPVEDLDWKLPEQKALPPDPTHQDGRSGGDGSVTG